MMQEFTPEAAKAAVDQAREVLDNILEVKGQRFIDAVSGMVHCEYLMISISMLLKSLQKAGTISNGEAVFQQMATLMASALAGWFAAAGLDGEKDREEVLNSANTIRGLTTFGLTRDKAQ